MADFNASLPVRTEAAGDVIVKLGDKTTPANQLAISAAGEADVRVAQPLPAGTNNIGDVDIASALPAGNNNIGDVDIASIAAGDNNIGNVDVLTEPATQADNTAGLPAVIKVVGGFDGTNVQALSTDSAGVLKVAVVSSALSSGEVSDYKVASAIAAAGTDNHDYTITAAKTFRLTQILAAASGKFKCEVRVGPVGSLVTKAVFFGDGSSGNLVALTLPQAIEVPDTRTGTIRVIMTNRSNQAQDLYSTIIGEEV